MTKMNTIQLESKNVTDAGVALNNALQISPEYLANGMVVDSNGLITFSEAYPYPELVNQILWDQIARARTMFFKKKSCLILEAYPVVPGSDSLMIIQLMPARVNDFSTMSGAHKFEQQLTKRINEGLISYAEGDLRWLLAK